MEFKLTLDATPVLIELLSGLVAALRGLSVAPTQAQVTTNHVHTPNTPALPPTSAAESQPPVAPSAPAPAATPAPTSAPAATPTVYTPEQVNAACASLIDAGRVSELRTILKDQFQVDSLQKMTPEQLADFVVVVRGMGAQI